MANKKWTEVSQPFQFPPSFTSKSFTLRKMYSRLLHDYEQVYFHRNGGLPIPPPGEPAVLLPGGWDFSSDHPERVRPVGPDLASCMRSAYCGGPRASRAVSCPSFRLRRCFWRPFTPHLGPWARQKGCRQASEEAGSSWHACCRCGWRQSGGRGSHDVLQPGVQAQAPGDSSSPAGAHALLSRAHSQRPPRCHKLS